MVRDSLIGTVNQIVEGAMGASVCRQFVAVQPATISEAEKIISRPGVQVLIRKIDTKAA